MKNNWIEMIILLNGNFVPLLMKESEVELAEASTMQAVREGQTNPLSILKVGSATILSKNIVGWYFRPKTETQSDKVIKFLEKKLPDPEGGDDWKKE